MREYRYLWRKHFGPIPKDDLGRSYEIHHIDGNRDNNDLSNLKCVSIQEHYDIHKRQGDWAACWSISKRLNLSARELNELRKGRKGLPGTFRGRKHSEETKKKLSLLNKGKKGCVHTEEAKKRISETHKGKPSHRKGKSLTEEHKLRIGQANRGKPGNKKGVKQSAEIIAKRVATRKANALNKTFI
jgi:hypothetical protein